jgi:hypothetical protein
LNGPSNKCDNANFIKFAFGDLPWTFVANPRQLLCTLPKKTSRVYKVGQDVGNEGG